MNKLTIAGMIAMTGLLNACTTTNQEPRVSIANPASEFCVKSGGKSEIRKNQDGSEYGVCILPNGQIVEEWDYFRKNSKA